MHKYIVSALVAILFCFQMTVSGCAATTAFKSSTPDPGALTPVNYQSPEKYLDALGLKIKKQLPDERFVMPTPGPRLALLEVFAKDINADIKNFIGKNLVLKNYLLQDHPLQQKLGQETEIIASLWLAEDKIVGGNIQVKTPGSTIYLNEGYSLRGRSLKEITNMDFNTWYSDWKNKTYGTNTENNSHL